MASVSKCRGRWTCRVRYQNGNSVQRTFDSKKEAIAWGAQKDFEISQGKSITGETHCFADVCFLYLKRITPYKAASTVRWEHTVINKLCRLRWAKVPLNMLDADEVFAWRDKRGQQIADNTIRREVSLIRSIARSAEAFGIHLDVSIFNTINKPAPVARIPDRITEDDMARLEMAADVNYVRNKYIKHLMRLAVETGMRRGELLDIEWKDVDLARGFIKIPAHKTKTRNDRDIPLTPKAREVIEEMAEQRTDEQLVFNVTGNAVRISFSRLRERAGYPNLHFHDFRHEAVSRFFDMGLTTPEVMAISGHRSIEMVEKYSHASTLNLVNKLQGAAQ